MDISINSSLLKKTGGEGGGYKFPTARMYYWHTPVRRPAPARTASGAAFGMYELSPESMTIILLFKVSNYIKICIYICIYIYSYIYIKQLY